MLPCAPFQVFQFVLYIHKDINKAVWEPPDTNSQNQIDHTTINRRRKTSLQDVTVARQAAVESYHCLVVGNIRVRLACGSLPLLIVISQWSISAQPAHAKSFVD